MLEFIEDNIPSVILTIAFLVTIPWGKNVWITVDTILSLVLAIACVFFPQQYLRFEVNGVLDGIHIQMLRMFGLVIFGTTLFSCSSLITKDNTVKSSVLWARVIGISVYILAKSHSYVSIKAGTAWNSMALYFGIYGCCLWLLGNLIYAISSTDEGGAKASHGSIDTFLRIDFVLTFLFAFLFFVFPGQMMGFQCTENLRGLHLCVIRLYAAFMFNTAIISGRAPNFPSLTDKINFLTVRLIVNASLVTAQLYTQMTTSYWTSWHIYFGMVGMSLWSINAAIGYSKALKSIKVKPDSKKD